MAEDRLSEVAAAIPFKAWQGTDGRGYRAWLTRHANQMQVAVHQLAWRRGSLDQQRLAAHELSARLSELIDSVELPRGYRFVPNRDAARSLALNGEMFAPSFRDPLPTEAAIAQLGHDLKTGWLQELEGLK